jgi:hypothetical protein
VVAAAAVVEEAVAAAGDAAAEYAPVRGESTCCRATSQSSCMPSGTVSVSAEVDETGPGPLRVLLRVREDICCC